MTQVVELSDDNVAATPCQEAKARFMSVCSEWADGLIDNGIKVRKAGDGSALYNLEKLSVPKVAYTESTGVGTSNLTVSITDLPEAQLRVWRAAYQLIVDAYKATPVPPYVPIEWQQLDRVTFERDHTSKCGYSVRVDAERGRIECVRHSAYVIFKIVDPTPLTLASTT